MRWWPVYVGAASLSVMGGVLGGQAVVAGMQIDRVAATGPVRPHPAAGEDMLGGSIEPVPDRSAEDDLAGRDLLASLDPVRTVQNSGCSPDAPASCAAPLP